jgi:hypothetical protein
VTSGLVVTDVSIYPLTMFLEVLTVQALVLYLAS